MDNTLLHSKAHRCNMFFKSLRYPRSSVWLYIASRAYAISESRILSSVPVSIPVPNPEVVSERLTLKNLELATRALHRDGLVVLEDVIDYLKLDALNENTVQDALVLQSAGDASLSKYNRRKARSLLRCRQ